MQKSTKARSVEVKASQKLDLLGLGLGFVLLVLGAWGLWGAEFSVSRTALPADVIGQLTEFKNDVRLSSAGSKSVWSGVVGQTAIQDGDSVYTTSSSSALVLLADQKIFLGEKTLVVMRKTSAQRLGVKISSGRMVLRPRRKSSSAPPFEIILENEKKILVHDDAVLAISATNSSDVSSATNTATDPDVVASFVPQIEVEVLEGRAELVSDSSIEGLGEANPSPVLALESGDQVNLDARSEVAQTRNSTEDNSLKAPSAVLELVSPAEGETLLLPDQVAWPVAFKWRAPEGARSFIFKWKVVGEAQFKENEVEDEEFSLDVLPEGHLEWRVHARSEGLDEVVSASRRIEIKKVPAPEAPRFKASYNEGSASRTLGLEIENDPGIEGFYECEIAEQVSKCDPVLISLPLAEGDLALKIRYHDRFERRGAWSVPFVIPAMRVEPRAVPPQSPLLDPLYEIEFEEDDLGGEHGSVIEKIWNFFVPSVFAEKPKGTRRIRWSPSKGARFYEVQIFSSKNFRQTPALDLRVDAPVLELKSSALAAGNYWIRVTAIGEGDSRSQSSVAKLVVRRKIAVSTRAPVVEQNPPPKNAAQAAPSPLFADYLASVVVGGMGANTKAAAESAMPRFGFWGLEPVIGTSMKRDVSKFSETETKTFLLSAFRVELAGPRWRLGDRSWIRLRAGYEYSQLPWLSGNVPNSRAWVNGPTTGLYWNTGLGERSNLRVGVLSTFPVGASHDGTFSRARWIEFPLSLRFWNFGAWGLSFLTTYEHKGYRQTSDTGALDVSDRGLKSGLQIERVSP